MPVTSFYAAGLLAALFWGISPIFSKRGLSHGGNPVVLTVVAIGTGFVMFWAGVALVAGPASLLPSLSPFEYGVFFVAGLTGSAFGRIASYTGVQRVGASVNAAVIASHPLFATILAFLFLDELVTATQAVGILVVVLGLVVLTLSRGGDLSGWTARDLLAPLLGAVVYGVGSVIRRYGLTTTPAVAIEGAALETTAAFVAVAAFAVASSRRSLLDLDPRAFGYFVGTGVFSSLGLLMVFVGLQNGPVAIVITLAGTATLLTTAFSYLLLDDLERVTRRVVAAAVLVVAGVALITAT